MKAKYIAFEGIDGSGKTKQLELLFDYFQKQGKKVLVTREFGSEHDYACTRIRDFALNSSYNFDELAGQFMFAACSTQHSEKVILPNLEKYDYILSDRSLESNLAYCAALGIDRDFAHSLFFLDKRRQHPDCILYLNISPEVSAARMHARIPEQFSEPGTDRIEAKGIEFQRKVRDEYSRRIEENPRYIVISSYETIEDTHREIIRKLELVDGK